MKFFKKFIVLLLCISFFTSSFANVNDEMRKTFSSMTNYSRPGSYQGQTRGVITGGNMYVREKITQQNLFSFKAPSMSSGCGGTDFFGGSFGFINASQFETMIQGIAANARGYAIGLAMDIVCPTCAANMKELQKRMQELSSTMSNSCEMGKMLVNKFTPLDEMADASRKESGTTASNKWKIFDTYFEGSDKSRSGGGNTNAYAALTRAQKIDDKMIGNMTWNALENANVGAWYTSVVASQAQLKQIMMSLVGTIITSDGTDEAGGAAPEPIPNKRLLSVKDFLFGKSQVDIYTCDDYAATECMTIGLEKIDIKGMLPVVTEMLMGDGASVGIIAKLRDKGNANTFTADEMAFISAASPGILGILRDFAHDTRSAASIADIFALTIAQEMTINFIVEMINNIQTAVSTGKNIGKTRPVVLEMIEEVRRDIYQERASNGLTLSGVSNAFQVASYVRSSLMSRVEAKRDPVMVQ
jgi:conjugative transfer pilus assembly protein TraH